MSDTYLVETNTVEGGPTARGRAGSFTLVSDRPSSVGGGGLGFNGGQLMNLAVAACVSNDLYREAGARGIALSRVRVTVDSDYRGDPAVSTPIEYEVEVDGDAPAEALDELVAHVDTIAEIPNSLRNGTAVRLRDRRVTSAHGSTN
jgi:putative redox protein